MFVGHLDLMKTFDRAARRAALPVSGAALGQYLIRGGAGGRQKLVQLLCCVLS